MGIMKTNVSSALKAGEIDSLEEKREIVRNIFLAKEGYKETILSPLPMDMSKRRYFRLSGKLLMDAPPSYENTLNFHLKAEVLRDLGLSVPEIYATDHDKGFLLIEDFGELTFRKALQKGFSEEMLYDEAIQALIHLHKHAKENRNHLPLYSLELFLKEADIFLEWYDFSFSYQAKEDFKGLWTDAYHAQPIIPHSLVMRDVMVDNLLWLSSQTGFKRCGFIDFQDGVWGPITYDLVSLLEDARRDIAPQFSKDRAEHYLKAFPNLNVQDFWASYNLWGAQRSTKILGVFSRFAKRDGKSHYLPHLPRVKMILERDLSHPSLQKIRNWFQSVVL